MQSGSSVRVHRRKLFLDGAPWSVLTPRPTDASRYATSAVDTGWQLECDVASLDDFAHLLWATAFQHHARTIFLFDFPTLLPNVEGEADSLPFVMSHTGLDVPSDAMLAELFAVLPLTTASDGTVRLRTAGLDRALVDPAAFLLLERDAEDAAEWTSSEWSTWVIDVSGVLRIAAPAPALRAYALAAAEFGQFAWESLDPADEFDVSHEFVAFDRSIVERAAALRAFRVAQFPGRNYADLRGMERQRLWEFTQRR